MQRDKINILQYEMCKKEKIKKYKIPRIKGGYRKQELSNKKAYKYSYIKKKISNNKRRQKVSMKNIVKTK